MRTADNCYVVATESKMTCHTTMIIDMDLWHQCLGHVNHTDLDSLAKNEIILGLPKRLKTPHAVCGPCQIGKQIRSSHKKVDALTTKWPLKLLHMDLMSPTKSESISSKKYISAYIWICIGSHVYTDTIHQRRHSSHINFTNLCG